MSARTRIVGAFIRAALWASRFAGPRVAKIGPAPTRLRIEADIETPLPGPQIATLLRRLADGDAHWETLLALAEGIEENHRPAPDGTRGSIVCTGEAMTIDSDDVGRMAAALYAKTRRVTREPGELVEIQLSVVVTSLATTRDAMPLTSLSIEIPCPKAVSQRHPHRGAL